jgi:fumarylacetoacetase
VSTDASHDSSLQSWVDSANSPDNEFPIQNLPFGIFQRRGARGSASMGVAIGDRVLDLTACVRGGLLAGDAAAAARLVVDDSLNRLMALGRDTAGAMRRAIVGLLERSNTAAAARGDAITLPLAAVELMAPARIGDYSDFYASIHHATNVGSMFRPDDPLLPNYKHVPIGYHGRASSVVVSGTPVTRPRGQIRDDPAAPPAYGPSRRLDYELEIGMFVGTGNRLGDPIPIARAHEHLWGIVIVNDWSARDIQTWEYQPLGPFLAKSFATSISPWVVTMDALEPFRAPVAPRPPGDPRPLPYLTDAQDQKTGAIDVTVEVWLRSSMMRARNVAAVRVSSGRLADLYWTPAQLLTHHASNGCNLQPGDLLASGTISGPTRESRGCLLERAWRGTEPVELPTGERRSFLEDGDEVTMRGYAEREGFRRIGLGECRAVISPSVS